MCDSDTGYLLGSDVIDTLMKIGNLRYQAISQAAGDLTQEHARLCTWIEKPNHLVCTEGGAWTPRH